MMLDSCKQEKLKNLIYRWNLIELLGIILWLGVLIYRLLDKYLSIYKILTNSSISVFC